SAPAGERGSVAPFEAPLEQMRRALALGLHDYVRKNDFGDVVLGVSGGIDSALTAALCAEALGPEHVHCVSMPSRYSSQGTRSDARRVAENLGCPYLELPIEAVSEAFADTLRDATGGRPSGLAAENLQARIRGTLLMALSNTFGWLVVSTGNKSELAVGYSTLYGDMVGGFALLKDVFKTHVWRLARSQRRAARGPARRGLAAALPRARPRARGVRRARPLARGAARGVPRRRRRARARARRPRRVQAPPGTPRREAAPEGVRTRLAPADHEPLARLTPVSRRPALSDTRTCRAETCLPTSTLAKMAAPAASSSISRHELGTERP